MSHDRYRVLLPFCQHVFQRTPAARQKSRAANLTESRQRASPSHRFGAGVTSALCLNPPTHQHTSSANAPCVATTRDQRGQKTQNCQEGKNRRNCRRLNNPCVERQLARVQTGEEQEGASDIKRSRLPNKSAIRCDDKGAHSDVTPRNLRHRPSRLLPSPTEGWTQHAHTHSAPVWHATQTQRAPDDALSASTPNGRWSLSGRISPT